MNILDAIKTTLVILSGAEVTVKERNEAVKFLKNFSENIENNKKKCDCECNQHYQKMRRLSDGE